MTDTPKGRSVPRHLVVVAHPREDSFNLACARRYCEEVERVGQQAVLHDLYRMNFDPVLRTEEQPTASSYVLAKDVEAEIEAIAGCDAIVLVYPIWFGMPPAMMKGYVDRVLGAGFPSAALREQLPNPVISGKRMLSISSSGNSRPWLEEQGAWIALRTIVDDYLRRGFSLQSAEHVHFASVTPGMKRRFVEEHLHEVGEAARRMCSTIAAGREPKRLAG